jgi:hypothetical protein
MNNRRGSVARHITSRGQCLTSASDDARVWAQYSITDEFASLLNNRGNNGAPDDQTFADALERYDSAMSGLSEAPSTIACVPRRWADLYDRVLERVYRAEIRREVERLRAEQDMNEEE